MSGSYSSIENHSRFSPMTLTMYCFGERKTFWKRINENVSGFVMMYCVCKLELSVEPFVDDRNSLSITRLNTMAPSNTMVKIFRLLEPNLSFGIQNRIGHRKA